MEIEVLEYSGRWILVTGLREFANSAVGGESLFRRASITFDYCWSKQDGWVSLPGPGRKFRTYHEAIRYRESHFEQMMATEMD